MPDRDSRAPKLVFFIVISVIVFGIFAWIVSSEAHRIEAESRIIQAQVPVQIARYEYMSNADRQDTIRFQSFLAAITIGWQPYLTLIAFMVWSLVVTLFVMNLRAGTLSRNYEVENERRTLAPPGEIPGANYPALGSMGGGTNSKAGLKLREPDQVITVRTRS